MKKFNLLAATSLALMSSGFLATPAFAQTAPAPTPAPQASEDEPVVDDVVVTATKRETTLLDTPISVSVTTGATIQERVLDNWLGLFWR